MQIYTDDKPDGYEDIVTAHSVTMPTGAKTRDQPATLIGTIASASGKTRVVLYVQGAMSGPELC